MPLPVPTALLDCFGVFHKLKLKQSKYVDGELEKNNEPVKLWKAG